MLRHHQHFPVFAKHPPHGIADLAQRGQALHGFHNRRHQVLAAARPLLHPAPAASARSFSRLARKARNRSACCRSSSGRSAAAQPAHPALRLPASSEMRSPPPAPALGCPPTSGNRRPRSGSPAAQSRSRSPAAFRPCVDLVQVFQRSPFHLVGQPLHVVGTRQRIDHRRHPLRTQRSVGCAAPAARTPLSAAPAPRHTHWYAAIASRPAPPTSPAAPSAQCCSAAAAPSASSHPSGYGSAASAPFPRLPQSGRA